MAKPKIHALDLGNAGGKGEQTRANILSATAKVLSNKGYAGTRLSDIAKEANVQAPAVYYYFDSREDLIVEVLWHGAKGTRQIVSAVLENLPLDTSPLDRILYAIEVHLRYSLDLSDFATASARNIGQLPEKLEHRPLEQQRAYGRLWRDLIVAANRAGQCRPGLDTTVSMLLVLGALNYAPEWFDPEQRSVESIISQAQSIVRFGLGIEDTDTNFPLPFLGDPNDWLESHAPKS